jgi:TupA-like ATPgrasp
MRARLWWGRPNSPPALVHWLGDLHRFRYRDDPEEAWHCCELWQRSVVHKWNGREFAARHGAPLPELYWHGGRFVRVPLERLPDDFVIRRVRGTWRKGVLVVAGGRELLLDEPASRDELRRRLAPLRRRPSPLLAEEFVGRDGERRLPLELKCHAFGGTVAAVEAVERTGPLPGRHRFYSTAWEPFPDSMNTRIEDADLQDAPACLDEVVGHASRLGAALGTYMRIDFFPRGGSCVFNEFASVPVSGLDYTPYCDELFGALWAEHVPALSS